MIKDDSTPQENWRKIFDVYKSQAQTNPPTRRADLEHDSAALFTTQVRHTGKYPDRLKVTSIAE